MSSITQTTSLKGALIWMGTCDEETCEDFDLTPYTEGQTNEGVINFIYQVGSGSVGEMWKGAQPSMFNSLNGSEDSNTLFCGKCYYIMLNPAVDSSNPFVLDIPGAKFDYSDSPKRGRIFDISSSKAQYLGDISQLPSVIAKGQFKNLITDADTGEEYTTAQTITTDKDGVYIKSDGSVHRFFSGLPFEIPAGSKLLKGKFGVLDTDGDGVPDTHDTNPDTSDRGSSGGITGFIEAGDYSSFVLKADGSLHATGSNNNGQLGDGTTDTRNSFSEVGLSEVSQIAAGKLHTLFIKTDGSLYSAPASGWPASLGHYGQRGDPSQHTSGVSQVAAGEYHSLMLKSDGSFWSAGYASYGQLGNGTTNRGEFVKVIDSGVAQIAAGANHSLIVKTDGSLWGMGKNDHSQLGEGTTINRISPIQILASGVSQIAAGGSHSLYLKSDGSLWAMGWNYYGQLGDGTTTNRSTPVEIESSGVSSVTAGSSHSLYLKSDGSLWAMGYNYYGQLGDGTITTRTNPTQILASGVSQIAAGANHSLIVKSDGSLHAFGANQSGTLGDGTTQRATPVEILPAGSISTLSEGSGGAIDNSEDALLESFKITLPGRNWTDLEFFWDPLTRKYKNKESNYNDWYIALDSLSNTWKTYLVYNNEPTEADEISASINILNTSQIATISDAVHFESPALPKSFVVTGGNIDNNAEGTYTLVFNSNSDFYYTNNNSSVEYQIHYSYDEKNWQAFSINPINGSSTFYKNATDPGVKFLTEIVANEVVEMGSDLQRTYLNPAYASKAQTVDETITFNGNSQMNSDWTANSFVMPDCAKSLSESYQFIPDTTGDFNLQRKEVAAYYPVPPRNRSEFYKELAPSIQLSTFGIPLGFGNWDSSNFTTDGSTVSNPETEEFCPAPYGRNKMRFEFTFENPTGSNGVIPVLDFAWDHYYKRYTARDMPSHADQDNNVPFASVGEGIGAVSEYETLIIPSSLDTSTRPFQGWYVATEGSGGTSVTWSIPFTDYSNKHKYKVLARTWFPSHDGDLPYEFWGDAGPELVFGTNKVLIQRITELSDHPAYSAEDNYLDSLYLNELEAQSIYGIPGGFVITGSSYDGVYGPAPGNTVDGLPVYFKNGVRGASPAFFAKVMTQTTNSDGSPTGWNGDQSASTIWRFTTNGSYIPDGHVSSDNIGMNTSSGELGPPTSRPWDYNTWSFSMVLTPTDGLTPL